MLKKKIKIIEDCSQAHGALYKNKPVGSFGDASTWSFCQDKIISTGGEGGMISTNNKKYGKVVGHTRIMEKIILVFFIKSMNLVLNGFTIDMEVIFE